ncbi:reprolysin-like metallopeptidase [Leisingera sp. NJS204]|uniref:reprolysin-like metallopeptidase n=1 Tax=Leisingera sp. NJS204 TaxID=2508307 RepID=UPI00101229AA|nr:zinc-dependent metalloprotease family protein [Leisingera sp. NJS204]QAX31580.1 type I secretion protein [Leisingera sp. NJS204]
MSEVTDYTALLAYTSNSSLRWNSLTEPGTQTVVTYSFVETSDLGSVADDPYGASSYWSFNSTQRDYFRLALAEFEEASGLLFVETDGPAMINAFGYNGGSAAGWADLAWSTSYSTNEGELAIKSSNMAPGSYGYETVLHEIGHALGLEHPHDGDNTLADHLDDQEHTVMTYNYAGYNVTELGTFDVQALTHLYGDTGSTAGWRAYANTAGDVVIKASSRAETVLATGQDTKIYAKGGDDTVIGREADDRLFGGGGADTLTGGFGEDRLAGGKGSDVLIGGLDETDYSGAYGEDDFLKGNGGRDTLFGGQGDDRLIGGNGKDRLVGGEGSDVLTGGKHADVFVFVSADYWEDEVIKDFGKGNDRIEFSDTSVDDFGDLTITQVNGNTLIDYFGSHEIELTGYTGTLTEDHFLFT